MSKFGIMEVHFKASGDNQWPENEIWKMDVWRFNAKYCSRPGAETINWTSILHSKVPQELIQEFSEVCSKIIEHSLELQSHSRNGPESNINHV